MITIGTQVESLNFGTTTVVKGTHRDNLRGEYITIRFENTCREKKVLAPAFLTGNVCDLHDLKVGDVLNSTLDGKFEITKIGGIRDVAIRFLDTGNILEGNQKNALICGYVRDKVKRDAEMAPIKAEREAASKKHKEMLKAAAVKRAEEEKRQQARRDAIAQKKLDEQARILAAENDKKFYQEQLRENAIKALVLENMKEKGENPNDLNIDFKDRDGRWVLRFQMNGDFTQTRLGRLHNNVTQRVGKNDGYLDVTISDEFKDAQKFCDWVVQQPGWGQGYTLEKDLLIEGNREYRAEACVFVPFRVNQAIIRRTAKSVVKKVQDGWSVTCHVNNLKIFLGTYPTQDEAYHVYGKYQGDYIKSLANFYKNSISEVAYQALIGWEWRERY